MVVIWLGHSGCARIHTFLAACIIGGSDAVILAGSAAVELQRPDGVMEPVTMQSCYLVGDWKSVVSDTRLVVDDAYVTDDASHHLL